MSATGTPASGPGSSPAATRRVDRVGRGAGPRRRCTRLKAWSSASRASMRGEVLLDDVDGPTRSPARTAAAISTARVTAPRPGSGGTRNRPSSAAGASASTSSRSRLGRTTSGRSTFASGYGCAVGGRRRGRGPRRRRRARGSPPAAAVNVSSSLVGQLEPGQLGDVGDVVTGERGHRRAIVGARLRSCAPGTTAISSRSARATSGSGWGRRQR